eukprot:ANDGO_06831.mRNA.1 hypothetical protein
MTDAIVSWLSTSFSSSNTATHTYLIPPVSALRRSVDLMWSPISHIVSVLSATASSIDANALEQFFVNHFQFQLVQYLQQHFSQGGSLAIVDVMTDAAPIFYKCVYTELQTSGLVSAIDRALEREHSSVQMLLENAAERLKEPKLSVLSLNASSSSIPGNTMSIGLGHSPMNLHHLPHGNQQQHFHPLATPNASRKHLKPPLTASVASAASLSSTSGMERMRYIVADSTGTITLLVEPEWALGGALPGGAEPEERMLNASSSIASTSSGVSSSSSSSAAAARSSASTLGSAASTGCLRGFPQLYYEGEVLELFDCRTIMHESTTSKRYHLQVVVNARQIQFDRFVSSHCGFRVLMDLCTVPCSFADDGTLHVLLVQKKETPAYRVFQCNFKEHLSRTASAGPAKTLTESERTELLTLFHLMADVELQKIGKKHVVFSLLVQAEMDSRRQTRREVKNDFWHLPVGSLEYNVEESRMESMLEACMRTHFEKTGIDFELRRRLVFLNDQNFAYMVDRASGESMMSVQSVQQAGRLTSVGLDQLQNADSDSVMSGSVSGSIVSTSTSGNSRAALSSGGTSRSVTSSSRWEFAVPPLEPVPSWSVAKKTGNSTFEDSSVKVCDWYVCVHHPERPKETKMNGEGRRDTGYVQWFPVFEAYMHLSRHYPFQARGLERLLSGSLSLGIKNTAGGPM